MKYLLTIAMLGWCSTVSAQVLNLAENKGMLRSNLSANDTMELSPLRLRIPDTPEAIQNAPLVDSKGREVQFRMLADPDLGLIIGTHRSDITLELIGNLNSQGDPRFLLTGRQGERLVRLTPDDLMMTDLSMREHCFEALPLEESDTPLNIQIALDVSGSMDEFRSDIADSFQSFMDVVPELAQCQVQLFNELSHHINLPTDPNAEIKMSSNPVLPINCGAFTDNRVSDAIENYGSGGTEIVKALAPYFEEILQRQHASNLVLLLSDGAGAADRTSTSFQRLKRLSVEAAETANAYMIVKWLGNYRKDAPISDIADRILGGSAAAQHFDQSVFADAKRMIDHQIVVEAKNCEQP